MGWEHVWHHDWGLYAAEAEQVGIGRVQARAGGLGGLCPPNTQRALVWFKRGMADGGILQASHTLSWREAVAQGVGGGIPPLPLASNSAGVRRCGWAMVSHCSRHL